MKNDLDLRRLLSASGLSLEDLGTATGIHATTLSRACNGLRLSDDHNRRIATALADALDRRSREVARAKRTVTRMAKADTAAAA